MKKNNKWLSLVVAIWLTLVMSLLAIYILEYIIPFWKNTKNIEQSVWAYYQADSWIEKALYKIIWASLWDEVSEDNISSTWGYSIKSTSSWKTLPPIWKWNSDFDKNFNKLRVWEPIQIEIWYGKVNTNNLKFYFRVPDLDEDNNYNETLSWGTLWIINWQLVWEDDILNSDWTQLIANDINWVLKSWETIFKWWPSYLKYSKWLNLNGSWSVFKDFYNWNWTYLGNPQCGSWSWCILKMSIVNNLELDDWISVPYLEWKIEKYWALIPLRYRIIETTWKTYWFQKSLEVKVPQQTINEAFDFTVFQ